MQTGEDVTTIEYPSVIFYMFCCVYLCVDVMVRLYVGKICGNPR